MDSCIKVWLQFIFLGYVWFVLIVIIILSQYSTKVISICGKTSNSSTSHYVPSLLCQTDTDCFQVLHYTNILCSGENNVTLLRWYIYANVQYLRGCHIPLFLFSLVVINLLIFPYIFTFSLYYSKDLYKQQGCGQKLSKYMKPFFDPYGCA